MIVGCPISLKVGDANCRVACPARLKPWATRPHIVASYPNRVRQEAAACRNTVRFMSAPSRSRF